MIENRLHKYLYAVMLVALFAFSPLSIADNDDLNSILSADQAPVGVVFEVVDWEQDYLEIAIPWVNQQIYTLRDKFPGLDIAVVSHGREQFALLKDSDAAYPEIHSNVQRLISDHDIKLELCLGHANMQGFLASDFPDYVDIEASGPSQIAAYEALGYDKVVVTIE